MAESKQQPSMSYGSPCPSTSSTTSILSEKASTPTTPAANNGTSNGSKKTGSRPCKDESQKIINFLLESYNSNSKKQGRNGASGGRGGQMTNDPNSSQVTQKFKNLQKEILSVCRRIKRANKSSHGLFDVLNNGDDSICLIIKRNQDGRIQVDGRKVWPHAFMYHIYLTFIKGDITRTLNTGNHSELRTKDSLKVPCKFPFTNDKSEGHLCINPLHYEEKLKIEVNHYIPKSSVAEPPKALAWKSNNSPNRASTGSSSTATRLDKPTNMSAPPQPPPPSQPRSSKSEKKNGDGTVHIDGSLIHELSISDKLWGGGADAEMIARNDQERIEMANNIIKYEETVARAAEKRSLHNTRSRSPRQNRKLQQEMLARGREEQEAKRDIQSIQQDLQTIDLTSDNLFDNSFDLTLQETLQSAPSPPLIPTVENVVGENEDFYIASQPITLVEQPEKPWTTITYYECNNKQATYDTVKPEINFYYKSTQKPQLYTKQHLENIEQFDLAMVKNVNRSTDTWDLLEKLEQGLTLIYDRQRRLVSVANNSPIKIYILSYLMNVDCGKHEQSLIQIAPGSQSRVVYDGRLFAQTIEDINNQTNSELEKWALVGQYASFFTVFRISFQPWGPQYPKKNLVECDLWLEVQMTEYLGWIQNLEDHYEYVMVQEGR